jgi:hydroxyacyl-ACP dehydratase HTD2-like protein with hotdog domain
MRSQVYFDDVSVGEEIPSLTKDVNTVNILMYVAAVWLMDRIHFDNPYAVKRRGLPDIVAPGNMAGDYYVQLLSDWAGEKGRLRKVGLQFRNFMIPGNVLTCGGRVTAKTVEDGKGRVDLDLWIRNQDGVVCVPGKGVVELPMRVAK